jgi:endonuclease YncB( thermonuclease family)
MRHARVLAVMLLTLLPTGARALEEGPAALIVEVIDGDTVVLEDGGEVRLVGIQAPMLSLGRAHVKDQPLAHEAKAALERLILGKTVRLGFGGARRDRHGRWLAHLHDEAGLWIQGALLEAGLARVYGFPDNRALIGEMLALERAAREAGRGLWADPFFAVLGAADDLPRDVYALVEGRITDTAVVRGRVYLNFGADWRTDFTITIGPKDATIFAEAGMDPLALEGRRVRVRGWIGERNGPMIEATHPEQIEILDP